MSIQWQCACGKTGKVGSDKAGRKGKCPACGQVIHIPMAPPPPPPPPPPEEADIFELAEPEVPVKRRQAAAPLVAPSLDALEGVERISSTPAVPPFVPPQVIVEVESASSGGGGGGARKYMYMLTVLALIPLGVSLFQKGGADIEQRLEQTVKKHPEVAPKLSEIAAEAEEGLSLDDVCNVLPGHRLDGSFLARDTWWHWAFALLSASAFMGLMVLMFPPGHASRTHLLWAGVFTATAGIIVLLAFQFMANWTQGFYLRGRSIVVLLFYIVKFIGFSYRCAEDPSNGFLLSFMGFTLGVGLCEELVKAVPLIWHYKTYGTLGWRAACLWGFASGVGFGVAEGIMYSSRYYNGVFEGDIYVVRFVSCVALHAVWAASVGVFLWKHQGLLNDAEGFFGVLVNAMVIVSAPMVLHGAYDTLLKKDMNSWALLVAGVSFLWLVYQIETARRMDPDEEDEETSVSTSRGSRGYAASM